MVRLGPGSEPPDEKAPVTIAGDLWVFDSRHQLLSGDSTDPDAVNTLMAGETATAVATDPPYNLKEREYSGKGRHRHGDFRQAAGELSRPEFTGFLGSGFAAVIPHLISGALIYAFMDWKHVRELLGAADANALELLNICIWDKGKDGMGAFYRSAHEMVFVFRNGDARHCTEKDDIVFDGFADSGTTLIAAQKLGRRARVIELGPVYCDTIIGRYRTAFGSEPVHQVLGLSFSQVAALRAEERASR